MKKESNLGMDIFEDAKITNMMQFPETWEEFEKQYGFMDSEEVYTNGARLIPSFRVEQWLEHLTKETYRLRLVQESVNTIMNTAKTDSIKDKCFRNAARLIQNSIDGKAPDFELIPYDFIVRCTIDDIGDLITNLKELRTELERLE